MGSNVSLPQLLRVPRLYQRRKSWVIVYKCSAADARYAVQCAAAPNSQQQFPVHAILNSKLSQLVTYSCLLVVSCANNHNHACSDAFLEVRARRPYFLHHGQHLNELTKIYTIRAYLRSTPLFPSGQCSSLRSGLHHK